ncbi:PREDICTED: aminopeptidase N-like [Acromyrmex echinatior]|uniref:aminopeptidase N-like n=1 Tax=Acromyrmex echinatior TaxID=103372 RepID=UPI000580E8B7|nr:PREDICTED: aminopeptidase N-like [Acromyrmex echinatior]
MHQIHKKSQTIEIVFDYPFLRNVNIYRVTMEFLGSITDDKGGIVKRFYINDKNKKSWLFIADLRGAGARQIFPCWDEPDTRTNFTISIKHDQYYRALSNTKVTNMFSVKHEKNWTHFEPTAKISPHHVMILLHDFKQIDDSNIWCREQVQQDMEFLQLIVNFTTLYLKFNDIIFLDTVMHVVIPDFLDLGMQSWGIILYRETNVLYDKKLDFIAWKFEVAFMIARKITHQYIGNLVAQPSWFHLWLNEGIATFLAINIVNQYFSPDYYQLLDLFDVKFQHESLRLNDYYNMSLVYEIDTPSDINSIFSFTHYIKAPVFIRSLDKMLPEDILHISINDYILNYKFKSVNTSTTPFEKFLGIIKKNLIEEANYIIEPIDVIKIFTQWAKQERYPVLKVQRTFSFLSFLREVKVHIVEPCPKNLSIPVTYITQRNPYLIHNAWLEKSNFLSIYVYSNHWIIINIQQAGYYRVNYDNDTWQLLGDYLNSMEYYNIQVLNRAQIIDDAYYFLSTNKLDFKLFKTLTYYLSKETDYIAWYPMFKILEQISGFFSFPQSSEVKEHFRNILDNVLKNIGYLDIIEENEFTKSLRFEAARWACLLKSEDCTNSAISHLIRFYEKPDPKTNPIVALGDMIYNHLHSKKQINTHSRIFPGWKEWMYRNGMMLANNITWNKVLTADALDNKRLEYLACSENNIIIINYIDQLISGYFTELKHRITVFHSIIARHAKNDLILNYILINFEKIVSIIPSKIETLIAVADIINYIYSTQQIDKVKYTLLEKVYSSFNLYYIDKKIELRLLQIQKHIGYFERFLKTKN